MKYRLLSPGERLMAGDQISLVDGKWHVVVEEDYGVVVTYLFQARRPVVMSGRCKLCERRNVDPGEKCWWCGCQN